MYSRGLFSLVRKVLPDNLVCIMEVATLFDNALCLYSDTKSG